MKSVAKVGDKVWLTFGGQRIALVVVSVWPNGDDVSFQFQRHLWVKVGEYAVNRLRIEAER